MTEQYRQYNFNDTYEVRMSIGISNARQELDVSPSDFFTEEEWNEMDPEQQEFHFQEYSAEYIMDFYLDIGIV